MKRWGVIICTLLLLLPVQGCKFKDLDLKLFVVAMGVDLSESDPDKLSVTIKAAVPMGDPKQASEKVLIMTEKANTIAEAVRLMKSRTDKELDFGHCKAVIFGESYAHKDIRQATDWVLRRRDMQLLNYTAVGSPSAKEVLNVQPVTERLPGNSLLQALSMDGTESPFIISPQFTYNLERKAEEIGEDPIMPLIEVKGESELNISKGILFNKKQAVMTLEPDEVRIYNILEGRNLKTSLNFKLEGVKYAYTFLRSSSSYKMKLADASSPNLEYKIKIQAGIEENSSGSPIDSAGLKELSAAAEQQLGEQIEKVLNKIHKTGTDPLGWGLHYRSRHWNSLTAEKEAWEDIYPQLDFKAQVRINIKYTGMIR
ncbi:Ger(x)C family spore germination protein [Paenibacillus pinistramenti]|uniref:Ger(x)C family spore germination protein n=1 Tax=Paenibacillus pinistramenti TaxID=1768003 RepID=UPI0011098C7F|nr:Ger(x)C family spore germination protein [Paenibacillus pinistramenti]